MKKMKIAVLGETRLPVLPYGPGGLGRSTHEIASYLAGRGHDVTLFAPDGSQFDGKLAPVGAFDMVGYEVGLDYSHAHGLSRQLPTAPILNLIGDRECGWMPPNTIVESHYMQRHYPAARLVRTGIDMSEIPFYDRSGDYLIFMGLQIGHKQPDVARWVAQRAGRELVVIGPPGNVPTEDEKWKLLGGALGLLCPYTIDASPRTPLEAAACGTPTLCLDGDGTQDHVSEGISGFICSSPDEMAEKVEHLRGLNRLKMRVWAAQHHDICQTGLALENYLKDVSEGLRW